MHFYHLIAVEAENADEATTAVESFLEPYNNAEYDWYEIGGRWSGDLDGANTMCAATDRAAFLSAALCADQYTVQEIRSLIEQLTGVLSPELTPEEMAADGTDPLKYAQYRERVQTMATQSAQEFADLCADPEPLAARYSMTGWRLSKVGALVAGYFTSTTAFYDSVYGSRDLTNLRERVETDPAQQWLVVVDLHN